MSTNVEHEENYYQGPGQALREARERLNMQTADVAKRLHLTNSVIQNIENEDFGDTPKFVFIRGYLRAYANLVNISGDEVISLFNSLNLREAPSDRPTRSLIGKQSKATDLHIRWITYGIGILLFILVIAWWNSQKSDPVPLFSENLEEVLVEQTDISLNSEKLPAEHIAELGQISEE